MIKKPIQGFWGLVKSMMKLEGALNKVYDSNLDGVIDADVSGYCTKYDANKDGVIDNSDKVDGYDAGTGANNVLVLDSNAFVPLANIPITTNLKIYDDFGDNKLTSRDRTTYTVKDPTFPQTGLSAASTGIKYTSTFIIPIFIPSLVKIRATWDASATDSVTETRLVDSAGNILTSVSGNTGSDVESDAILFSGEVKVEVAVTTASATTSATTDVNAVDIIITPPTLKLCETYRPEWTIVQGTPSVSNGYLTLSSDGTTGDEIQIESDITVATWKVDWQSNTTTGGSWLFLRFMEIDDSNYYRLMAVLVTTTSAYFWLEKIVNGTITGLLGPTVTADTNWHHLAVSRDESGNFEIFFDGVSQGTATDTSITTSKYLALKAKDSPPGGAYSVHADNLEVIV